MAVMGRRDAGGFWVDAGVLGTGTGGAGGAGGVPRRGTGEDGGDTKAPLDAGEPGSP